MSKACLGGRTGGRLRKGGGLGRCWRIEGAIACAPKTLHALGTLILQFGGGSGLVSSDPRPYHAVAAVACTTQCLARAAGPNTGMVEHYAVVGVHKKGRAPADGSQAARVGDFHTMASSNWATLALLALMLAASAQSAHAQTQWWYKRCPGECGLLVRRGDTQ